MKRLVEIIWDDAASGQLYKEDFKSSVNLLYEQRTYGRIYNQDKKAITICTSENKCDIDYVVIPNPWIKEIIYYDINGKSKKDS